MNLSYIQCQLSNAKIIHLNGLIIGTEFLYTTHGWTLVSAVVEGASGLKFEPFIKEVFKDMGLDQTYLDENEPLIYNRAK